MNRKNNLFNVVPVERPNRNMFDLSHEVKMSGKFGFLYPVMTIDAMPGDVIRDHTTVFARFAPMLAPIMHRVDVTVHTFFVPYRILTDLWESFITAGRTGTENPVLPYFTPAGLYSVSGDDPVNMLTSSLWDYLGLPTLDGSEPATFSAEHISALPFIAYAKIWNDYYRDPNLDAELDFDAMGATGNVAVALEANNAFGLRRRGWQKDYFTAALPWAQRGTEVLMPLSGTGSVTYKSFSDFVEADGGDPVNAAAAIVNGNIGKGALSSDAGANFLRVENIDDVLIDASSVSINDLRTSLALQRWMENNARGGGRYIEQIESHYGVKVPDYRLQRPEYLGGGKQPVTISEVLQTAPTESSSVGDMAGHGVSVGNTNRFSYKCSEHGIVMSILSVLPQTAYQQGIEKMWSKTNRFDYAFPELAHLGEQEILSKEVFFSFDVADDDDNQNVFGYIPRYSEYKFKNDRVAGDFRTSLDFWHLGRKFITRPVLASAFTTMYEESLTGAEDSYRRIFAVQDGTDYLWLQIFHRCTAMRPLPYFGVPRILA